METINSLKQNLSIDVFADGFINNITHAYNLANGVNHALGIMLGANHTPPKFTISTYINSIPTVDEYNEISKVNSPMIYGDAFAGTPIGINGRALVVEINLAYTLSKTSIINVTIIEDINGKQLILIKYNVMNQSINRTFLENNGDIEYPIIALDSVHGLVSNNLLLSFIEDSLTTKYTNVCSSTRCPSYDLDIGCTKYNIMNGDKCHLMVYAESIELETYVTDVANSFCIDQGQVCGLPTLEEINRVAHLWGVPELTSKK